MGDKFEITHEEMLARARTNWRYRFWEAVLWPRYQIDRAYTKLKIWTRNKLKRPAARLLQWTLFVFERVEMDVWTDLDADKWSKQKPGRDGES